MYLDECCPESPSLIAKASTPPTRSEHIRAASSPYVAEQSVSHRTNGETNIHEYSTNSFPQSSMTSREPQIQAYVAIDARPCCGSVRSRPKASSTRAERIDARRHSANDEDRIGSYERTNELLEEIRSWRSLFIRLEIANRFRNALCAGNTPLQYRHASIERSTDTSHRLAFMSATLGNASLIDPISMLCSRFD